MNRRKENSERKNKSNLVMWLALSFPIHAWILHLTFSSLFSFIDMYIMLVISHWQVMYHKSIQFLTNFSHEFLLLHGLWWCVTVTLATGQLLIQNTNTVWENFTAQQGYCDWSEQPVSAANAESKFLSTLLDVSHGILISSCTCSGAHDWDIKTRMYMQHTINRAQA